VVGLNIAQLMRPPKYALETLATLRDSKAHQALGRLAAAIDARLSAERALGECRRRRAAHDNAAALLAADEERALARGELAAADLARADAWKIRVLAERKALEAQHDRTLARHRAALDDEARARETAIACRSDARLVQEDRRKWIDRLRALVEAAEDEARSEAWQPRR
jgi:FtsZ-binding cell division protein ZapB